MFQASLSSKREANVEASLTLQKMALECSAGGERPALISQLAQNRRRSAVRLRVILLSSWAARAKALNRF